jgi:hypothetical protein
MKEKKKMVNKSFENVKKVKIDRKSKQKHENEMLKKVTVLIQGVLAILLFSLSIMYIFIPELLVVVQTAIVLFLSVGAYNSYKLFGKKKMSYLYILAVVMVLSNMIMVMISGK